MVSFIVGAGLALPLAAAGGCLALLGPAALGLVAAALSFVPAWIPSDFPGRQSDRRDRSPSRRTGYRTEATSSAQNARR
jgi:hypothetical protein